MSRIECLAIDEETSIEAFCYQLRWNDLYYLLARGL
jgi:L-arabinose isomerase